MYKPRIGLKDEIPDEEWQKIKPNQLADAYNRMFSEDYNGSWGSFASTKWFAEEELVIRTGYMSLEYIHNNIHNLTCGSSLGYKTRLESRQRPSPTRSGKRHLRRRADVRRSCGSFRPDILDASLQHR